MDATILLLIDLQRDFLEADGRLPVPPTDAERVIGVANRMIDHARRAGWSMLWIKNEFRRAQWIGNYFRKYSAMEGSRGADIDPRINFVEAPVIVKCAASAFSNPQMEARLKETAPRRVILLGLMTDECVQATAKRAVRLGFNVEVIEDGTASMDARSHQKGLAAIRALGATLRNSADILTSEPVRS